MMLDGELDYLDEGTLVTPSRRGVLFSYALSEDAR
jgi:hypothetical protein